MTTTHILVLAASKGGVGKTTLSASLAVRAVQKGKRIALIDRDPQESLAAWADRGGRRANPHLIDIDSTAEAIGLALADPTRAFDYVIIDTPPSKMDLIDEAISQGSFILIPCQPTALDLTALDPVVEMCRENEKPFAFVLTRVSHMRNRMTKSAGNVIRKYGPLCNTTIADRTAYQAAMTLGKGPSEVERDKQAANELDRLWEELEGFMP